MESQLLNKIHNFGIYRKGGKRCILQLDFPSRLMLLIQKGHIKKTHPMSVLEHYDSGEGLHITIKLKDGEMMFEADNMEEKYTLCCLLGMVMHIGLDGDEDSIDSGHGHGYLSDHHIDNSDVIKDGLLEKKGHTAITTWNKRRIKLVPGELSYYKPGEELALNVIQLWKDRCLLKKHQHNGFTLTIRSRVYSFRTVHEFKATHMTEIARDDWYEAFERAMNMPPTVSKILDFSDITMRHLHNDTRSSIDSNASHRSSNSSTGSNSSYNNSNNSGTNSRPGEHFYDSTPDVLENFMDAACVYTQPIPKRLRGNTLPSTSTTTTTPSSDDKHILAFLRRSQSSEDLLDSPSSTITNARRQSREFHGLSPLLSDESSGEHRPILASSASTSDLLDTDKEDVFSGTAAAFRAKLALRGGKSSSLKNYRAQKEMKQNNSMNNYKMDGMKRGVCRAYNMFLMGADFRARSLDRNPSRSLPQFHPIIEAKSSIINTTATTTTETMTSEPAAVTDEPREVIQSIIKDSTDFKENTLMAQTSSSLSSSSTSSPSPITTATSTITQDSNDNRLDENTIENQIQPDQDSLLYYEAQQSVDMRKIFNETNDVINHDQHLKKPRELSTFSSTSLMPSTEAATLLIRDKTTPTITITTPHSEPLTTSTPITAPKNNKNKAIRVPPLPVAPPSLSRQNKTSPSYTHNKNKTEKPLVPPPSPPIVPPIPSSLPPPPPPPPPTFDQLETPGIAGPYTEIADFPPPPVRQADTKIPGLRLKQIHWTKVGNSQLTSSLWKDVNDVTDKLDLTELEEQFAVVNSKSNHNKNSNNSQDKQMLVDSKRAQNLGILFSGLKLDSIQRLTQALNSTTELETFSVDRLATLKRYQPTTEELEMYRSLTKKGNTTELHDVDRFMLQLCDIPKLGLRLDMVLTLWEFPGQYVALHEELTDIIIACDQLLNSVALAKVLEYILAIGNVMNSTWGCKQDAGGFQLSSLDKILSVKGRDSKTTLCGYLVRQLHRNDRELLSWTDTVQGVTKCSGYSTKAVGAEIDVLKNDLQKIKRCLKSLRHISSMDKTFLLDVQNFIVEHDRKLNQLDLKYGRLNDKYQQLVTRFGEQPNNCADSIFTIMCGFVSKFNQAKAEQEV